LRLQARQLLHQEVFLTYLAIAIIMVGQLAFGTFQVAMLTRVTGIAEAAIPYYLLLGGAGAVAGIWLGGKGADWNIDASILIVIAGQIVTFALLLVAVYDPIAVGIMLFFSAFFGFGFSTPVQLRILHGARAAPRLASTMVSTAYNIGIAAGAALGALLLSGGLSYAMLPVVGIGTSTLAGIIALVSVRLPHSSNLAEAS
jgi:DHA1 family inner membrane transport protein